MVHPQTYYPQVGSVKDPSMRANYLVCTTKMATVLAGTSGLPPLTSCR